MTPDAIGSLVRQIATTLLTGSTVAAYLSNSDAVAVAGLLGTAVSVAWSVIAHWGKVKVPAKA